MRSAAQQAGDRIIEQFQNAGIGITKEQLAVADFAGSGGMNDIVSTDNQETAAIQSGIETGQGAADLEGAIRKMQDTASLRAQQLKNIDAFARAIGNSRLFVEGIYAYVLLNFASVQKESGNSLLNSAISSIRNTANGTVFQYPKENWISAMSEQTRQALIYLQALNEPGLSASSKDSIRQKLLGVKAKAFQEMYAAMEEVGYGLIDEMATVTGLSGVVKLNDKIASFHSGTDRTGGGFGVSFIEDAEARRRLQESSNRLQRASEALTYDKEGNIIGWGKVQSKSDSSTLIGNFAAEIGMTTATATGDYRINTQGHYQTTKTLKISEVTTPMLVVLNRDLHLSGHEQDLIAQLFGGHVSSVGVQLDTLFFNNLKRKIQYGMVLNALLGWDSKVPYLIRINNNVIPMHTFIGNLALRISEEDLGGNTGADGGIVRLSGYPQSRQGFLGDNSWVFDEGKTYSTRAAESRSQNALANIYDRMMTVQLSIKLNNLDLIALSSRYGNGMILG